jgi:5-methylcytosine-specific restriction endonuclease McrA
MYRKVYVTRPVRVFLRIMLVSVFVLDKKKNPLMPCSEKRARLLLKRAHAVIVRVYPFSIRLKDRVSGDTQPLRLGIDPGSKTTGLMLARESEAMDSESGEVKRTHHVVWLAELTHRGHRISEALTSRRSMRNARRGRHTPYRKARFLNRGNKSKGWLAPSLQHRVDTIMSWVKRLQRTTPIKTISQELVRFDMQIMQNPEINGIEYQHGTLRGYELKEYLLEKWGRTCAYCESKHVPLQIDHIQPKASGGSNRVCNLTLACEPCNIAKGAQSVTFFLAKKPEHLARILTQAKKPLKDAAAVNSTRWALFHTLETCGLPVETGTGGRTKWNRYLLNLPKSHALDALCIGNVDAVKNWQTLVFTIKATGRGCYQRTRLTAHRFPRGYLLRKKSVNGFQTGDMVSARVPKGIKAGIYVGRAAVRASGYFNIQTAQHIIQGVSHRHCKLLQRADGYGYSHEKRWDAFGILPIPPRPQGRGISAKI